MYIFSRRELGIFHLLSGRAVLQHGMLQTLLSEPYGPEHDCRIALQHPPEKIHVDAKQPHFFYYPLKKHLV